MLKETNLDGVKSVARMLLMIPIRETPYSPAVVQHPFTSCGIASLNKGGKFQLLDITAKEEDLKIWQEFMKSKIEGAENVWGIYAFINKPYGLTFLKFAEPYLSKEDFSKLLADAWVRSENPNDAPNFTKRDLIAMFKRADKQALMTEEDYKRWQDLEKSITVYRGVTPHNEKNIRALSWTLDAEKAEWFAMRFGENGKVYQAEIDKKDVYAYFGGRGESEVIVNPKGLQDITLVEEIEQTINQSTLKVINGEIIEQEEKRLYHYKRKEPYSGWSMVLYAEVSYENGLFELHLLIDNKDKKGQSRYWYLTVSGTNIIESRDSKLSYVSNFIKIEYEDEEIWKK